MYLLASDGNSLIGLWNEGQRYHGGSIVDSLMPKDELTVFAQTKEWLDQYFAGERPTLSGIPLAPLGGQFRQDIWSILLEIPYGNVVTYGEIASQMATRAGKARMSAQAVGGAVGHNPISIIIPCHRVVGSNGSLTGYAAGIDVKISLLEREGVDMAQLHVPTQGTAL